MNEGIIADCPIIALSAIGGEDILNEEKHGMSDFSKIYSI
jgi:hypothetical protein